ncbi:MAG: sugar phosphate isomerase/epimerase family protein [bacterium]
MNIPVALQLYTVREETEKDFKGTLSKVAEIGYKGVEFAGYGGLSASELKKLLDDLGLKAAGSHVPYPAIDSDLDRVIQYNLEIDNKYISIPYMEFEGKEEFIKTAEELNKAGEKCKEAGIQLCYHNHNQEFEVFDGTYGLDLLYQNSDAQNLQVEIDTFWAKYAGVDPVEYINKYSGRIPLVHLKDMEANEEKDFAEVGEGIMDIESIAQAAEKAGAKWLIVEQDQCKRSPLESIEISFNNLKKMGLA